MEIPSNTTCEHTLSTPEDRLVLTWYMGAPGHQLQSRWVGVHSLTYYLAQAQGLLPQTDSLLDKGSESNLPVLLLVQSVRYDC